MLRILSIVGLVVVSGLGAIQSADAAPVQEKAKKLIEFGWDEPGTQFIRGHISEMQGTPFDGCVFHVNFIEAKDVADDALWTRGGSGNFSWAAWSERAFSDVELSRAVADLQSTDFGSFNQNFVRLNVTPGKIDWFDDFSAVVNNCRLASRVARDGKCKGVLFDTEQYEGQLFDYRKQRDAATKNWESYATQARWRGTEVMRAFQDAYPDVTVMLTFGHSLPWYESQGGKIPLAECENGLLASFLDGMVDASNGQSKIVDGHEPSYGYREPEKFAVAYRAMKTDLLKMVADPKKYSQVVSCGFGIWMDYRWQSRGWDTADFAQNHFTPESFAASVETALRRSDEFVWVYSEQPRWWTADGGTANLPKAYADALKTAAAPKPPTYLPAQAFYITPESHNNQSGYFSLCEGLDGNVYIGTARYGENSHLVELDPRSGRQRMVVDTHKLCGLAATGFAAQAKIHTRNFVGPSGKIYLGSKQGYRLNDQDTAVYPGGYVMTYDPRTAAAENLGMPFPGQGIADVVADEARGLLYVVTCEDQHWMLGTTRGAPYRELGPLLTPYAMTLVAADGCGYALTKDFQLARYNPATGQVDVRPIELDGERWTRANEHAIPTWVLSADRQRAYLILMNDATLLEIELTSPAATIKATSRGKLVEGRNPDSRCGLDLGADGNVYAVIRTDNQTGFGTGYLHHLARYSPETGAIEDLGALTVRNPDYFNWSAVGADGKPLPWTHGFHRLPDGTLTPLHAHMSLKCAADNTIYVTIIYPFTLLRVEQFRTPPVAGASAKYLDWGLGMTERAEKDLPHFIQLAEVIADRHLRGGLIGFPLEWQALPQELWGRSGGMMHVGFGRSWKAERTADEKAHDVGIVGFAAVPTSAELETLRQHRARGVYLVGIGARRAAWASEAVLACDAWLDTGLEADDRVVDLGSGRRAGHGTIVANAIYGWTLTAEVVGALTRRGKMPPMWKGFSWPDGHAWADKYFGKMQFHDDVQVAPQPAGALGGKFLEQIHYPLRRIRGQSEKLRQAAELLAPEIEAGRKVHVVWQGHMPPMYLSKSDDDAWGVPLEFHPSVPQQVEQYRQATANGELILNLGHHGIDPIEAALRQEKKQRVIHLSGEHLDPAWQVGSNAVLQIDLGFAFGDACATIEGYPIRVFAPSGIAQAAAYEALKCELQSRGK
jgi:hypothetical protein